MKRTLLSGLAAIALILSVHDRASATIHNISVGDNFFNPAAVSNVMPGDTVRWTLMAGAMSHTTTGNVVTGIPTAANPWNATLSTSNPTFSYVPTAPGTYYYVCTIHSGMAGNFTVGTATNIKNVGTEKALFISPNPASTQISINAQVEELNVTLIDLCGRMMQLEQTGNSATVKSFAIPAVSSGMYMVRIKTTNEILTEKLMIRQ